MSDRIRIWMMVRRLLWIAVLVVSLIVLRNSFRHGAHGWEWIVAESILIIVVVVTVINFRLSPSENGALPVEPGEWSVEVLSLEKGWVQVAGELRRFLGCDSGTIQPLISNFPSEVASSISERDARRLAELLREAGAVVRVHGPSSGGGEG